ncbi:MAG: hypothetical protein AMXMBFR58_05120 [Phycisphaerae bacterium]
MTNQKYRRMSKAILCGCIAIAVILFFWIKSPLSPTGGSPVKKENAERHLISQLQLETQVQNNGFVGLTLEEASSRIGGYKFRAGSQHMNQYSAYVEHLGYPIGVFILDVVVDSHGKIVSARLKYD